MEWTQEARGEFERYCAELRASLDKLDQEGVDPAEVVEDIRTHVREELESRGLQLVDLSELSRVLGAMGSPARLTWPSRRYPCRWCARRPRAVRRAAPQSSIAFGAASARSGRVDQPVAFFTGVWANTWQKSNGTPLGSAGQPSL